MRAGGCTVQQALTPDAATMVIQAVSLARRRGHAQVTPLHVATAMLSSSTGLLRSACLHSHSHPLQCKALELCFNVALNRLPASFSPSHHPSLSNALVAAFKRAQAHQRRGSVETQQQPLLAVKIELEQLIISILDDPSVSRVMREAGFSSTQVKNNVESAVSSEPTSPQFQNPNPKSNDVMRVIDSMVSKRSVAIIGESLASTEGVLRGLMERVKRGEVPEAMMGVQLITFPLSSFGLMSRGEVEHKVGELRGFVRTRGAILYLGDLKWAAEYWDGCEGDLGRGLCSNVGSVMREIGEMVSGGIGRFWVVGAATYETYTKCRRGDPSLETLLGLQPLDVPNGSLDLSLNFDCDSQTQFNRQKGRDGVCGDDLSIKFDAADRVRKIIPSITSNLPSWLQKHKESQGATSNFQDCIQLNDSCKEWNSTFNKQEHHSYEKTLINFSISPSSSSVSSHDQHHYSGVYRPHPTMNMEISGLSFPHESTRLIRYHQSMPVETYMHDNDGNPNSATSSTDHSMEAENPRKFTEINSENLKTLCQALEEAAPLQTDIIPEIASTILQTRSGMMTRKKEQLSLSRIKEETWLFFKGSDVEGKEKIARELANLIFGSHSHFVSIGMNAFSSTKCTDSTDDRSNKRSKEEGDQGYLEKFVEAIRENPHQIIMLEDIDQVDSYSQFVLKNSMERGSIESSNGDEVNVSDAIIILSCEGFDSRSRASSPRVKQRSGSDEDTEEINKEMISTCIYLDLNVCAEDEEVESWPLDDVGLNESVDGTFFFKLPDDL